MNLKKLTGHLPDAIMAQLDICVTSFDINTNERMAHFLGQCSEESMWFEKFEENLNYSSNNLLKIFPKHFTSAVLADMYAHDPEKIASRIYADRMGNGNEASKDGFKYKGRGAIMCTGKDNYKALGLALKKDLVSNPDSVSKEYTLVSAAWFFSKNNLNKIADEGVNDEVCKEITGHVNGGQLGISERIAETNKFYQLLIS